MIVIYPKTLVARLNHLYWLISSCDVYELWTPPILTTTIIVCPQNPSCEFLWFLLNNFFLWFLWMVDSTDSYNSDFYCLPYRLQGNPICTGAALVNANPTLCNGTVTSEATNWTSPLLSSNTCTNNCDNTHTLNPESCLCGYPLVIGLEIRSPPWTDINNTTLWDSLHDQTVNQLGIQSTQVWVRQAYFTESKRARADIYFFPVSGESLDLNTQVYITEAFTGQRVHYDNLFKPSITVFILMPPGDDSTIFG